MPLKTCTPSDVTPLTRPDAVSTTGEPVKVADRSVRISISPATAHSPLFLWPEPARAAGRRQRHSPTSASSSLRRHDPRCCIQPDPIGSIVCRKRRSHGRQRRGPDRGIFPKNLAESSDPRTNRQHGIEVAAADLFVTGRDLDLPEAGSFQNAAYAV